MTRQMSQLRFTPLLLLFAGAPCLAGDDQMPATPHQAEAVEDVERERAQRPETEDRMPVTERLWLTLGGRLENFSGATNADSPLFRSEFNATFVAGLSFTFYRSRSTVRAGGDPFD